MEKNILHFLAPGTTLQAVTNKLKLNKTLLGVDAVLDQELIGLDLNEDGMLNFLEEYRKAEIFLRVPRPVWKKADPEVSPLAGDIAEKLGLKIGERSNMSPLS